jgi:hypothetical protein
VIQEQGNTLQAPHNWVGELFSRDRLEQPTSEAYPFDLSFINPRMEYYDPNSKLSIKYQSKTLDGEDNLTWKKSTNG